MQQSQENECSCPLQGKGGVLRIGFKEWALSIYDWSFITVSRDRVSMGFFFLSHAPIRIQSINPVFHFAERVSSRAAPVLKICLAAHVEVIAVRRARLRLYEEGRKGGGGRGRKLTCGMCRDRKMKCKLLTTLPTVSLSTYLKGEMLGVVNAEVDWRVLIQEEREKKNNRNPRSSIFPS